MKKMLALGLALALVGCSDDGEKKTDQGVKLPDGTVYQDTGSTVYYDTGTTKQDTGNTTTSPNSGQTCDTSTPCPTGDSCLSIQIAGWPQDKGMCFGTCPSQGAQCSVGDSATQLATCGLTSDQVTWYCLYICEYQGKTYQCPDPATQQCVADAQNPGAKICIPKGAAPTPDAGL